MSALAVVRGTEDSTVADLELVARVRAGDDRAFELLFLRYQPRIAAYVAGMVRDHARAEDITQEVFLAALRRMRSEDAGDREIQFRPWIYEIAKNRCIDAYRRTRNVVEVSFDAHAISSDEHHRLAGPGPTPDDAVDGKLAFDNLRGAFGGLSDVHRDLLVMREFEGLSYREIGERLGMSRPAVESTLFRARKRLSEEYEQLVSGDRCTLVQQTVDAAGGLGSAGLRDQRRIARHLAHCQPCRRYARLAGADPGDLGAARRARAAAARVAAVLPLPAFLRRRGDDADAAVQLLGSHGARPVAQWSAHVASTVDPGVVTGWTKAVATAATVAVAGVGAGSAISGHQGVQPPAPFRSGPVHVVSAGAPTTSAGGGSAAAQAAGVRAAVAGYAAARQSGVALGLPAGSLNGAAPGAGATKAAPSAGAKRGAAPTTTQATTPLQGLPDGVTGGAQRPGGPAGGSRALDVDSGRVPDVRPSPGTLPALTAGVTGVLSGPPPVAEPVHGSGPVTGLLSGLSPSQSSGTASTDAAADTTADSTAGTTQADDSEATAPAGSVTPVRDTLRSATAALAGLAGR